MRFRIAILLAAVCALAVPFTASAKNMKPGKWELTFEMSGGPMAGHPFTTNKCVTPEEAASNEPPKARENSECKVTDMKIDGNTVSWKVSCAKSGATGDGTATYTGDSFNGTSHIKMGEQEFTQKFSGKFLGACDK